MATTSNSYCPYRHAQRLGIVIEHRHLPKSAMVAAYSPDTDRIYLRPGLTPIVERCALAHEIVHWEHGDTGTAKEEARANRISASRLIRQHELERLLAVTLDLQYIARELDVTVKTLTTYLGIPDAEIRNAQKGKAA